MLDSKIYPKGFSFYTKQELFGAFQSIAKYTLVYCKCKWSFYIETLYDIHYFHNAIVSFSLMNFYKFIKTRVEHTEIIQGEENSHEHSFSPFPILSLMYHVSHIMYHDTIWFHLKSLF